MLDARPLLPDRCWPDLSAPYHTIRRIEEGDVGLAIFEAEDASGGSLLIRENESLRRDRFRRRDLLLRPQNSGR